MVVIILILLDYWVFAKKHYATITIVAPLVFRYFLPLILINRHTYFPIVMSSLLGMIHIYFLFRKIWVIHSLFFLSFILRL